MKKIKAMGIMAIFTWSAGCFLSREIGESLVDAGEAIMDGNVAHAQRMETLPCNIEERWQSVTEDSDGSVTTVTQTRWFAELEDLSIDPDKIIGVQTISCDKTYFGNLSADPTPNCPSNGECTGGFSVELRCEANAEASIENGRIRIACGERRQFFRTEPGDKITTRGDSGFRWAFSRVTLNQ